MSRPKNVEWDPGNLPPSQQRLVDDLKAEGGDPELIRRTRAGTYHDYASGLAYPKINLVRDLTERGFLDLAENARDGKYDP